MDDIMMINSQPRIHSSAGLRACKIGRYCSIGERVSLAEVTMGDFSYIQRHSEGIYANIGKFCSIASNVCINALEHPMERITTHKMSYRPNEYFRFRGIDSEYRSRRQGRPVNIGNDVWIGHGAVLLPGISIGDGAVIGANAVVTKDVKPYTVMAGVPARKLRMRFPSEIALRLQQLSWWDWSVEKLFEAMPDIQNMSPVNFLEKWEIA